MKLLLISILTGIGICLQAQIKLSINIENSDSGKIINFSIINTASNTYVLPLDTIGFKTYHSENKCTDLLMVRNYPDLGLIPIISDDDNVLEGFIEDKGIPRQGNNLYKKKDEIYQKKRKSVIDKWRVKYRIKNKDDNWINKNRYLFNHLLILKPNQKISFNKKFDHMKINEYPDIYYYDYYPLKENDSYEIFFKICIDESIYQFLTKEQKEQLKDYIFFKGKIESNKIEFKY